MTLLELELKKGFNYFCYNYEGNELYMNEKGVEYMRNKRKTEIIKINPKTFYEEKKRLYLQGKTKFGWIGE